jgi:hypothetical protein
MAPMQRVADWTIEQRDIVEFTGISTLDEAFTTLVITFTDIDTGEERAVSAEVGEPGLPMMERVVHAKHPTDAATAQTLADEAVDALGGLPVHRYWVTLGLDAPLRYRNEEARPASGIRARDTVSFFGRPEGLLHVFDVRRDSDSGTILVMLAEDDLGRRLDVELKLLALAGG